MKYSLLFTLTAGYALALPGAKTPRSSRVAFAGLNIAGFDFGVDIWGNSDIAAAVNVASDGSGIQQMEHFVKNDGLNAFRLPVAWQYLVNNVLGGPLHPANAAAYDKLVHGCVSAGAKMCIVDIHNYARWYRGIIGQGGVTNEDYTSLVTQLATRYKGIPQVAFDIMNEPHDLDMTLWAKTAQLAVAAIRNAGATDHIILIPGTDFASAGAFPTASGPALMGVKNPDGSTKNLIFNVHQYLDQGAIGNSSNCITNNINDAFAPLAQYLRANKRTAMLTETGGGPTDTSCMQMFCQQNDFINQNADVFKGVIGWAAGGFATDYVLSQTPLMKIPNDVNGGFNDQPLTTNCMVAKFRGVTGVL